MLWFDRDMLMILVGLGTKRTWAGLDKDYVLSYLTVSPQSVLENSDYSSKIPGFVATTTQLEISRCVVENIQWFDTYKCWNAVSNTSLWLGILPASCNGITIPFTSQLDCPLIYWYVELVL